MSVPSLDCEALSFSFKIANCLAFKGALVYRPPGRNKNSFLALLNTLLETCALEDNFTILGDFNFHLDMDSDPNTISPLDTMTLAGLNQRVKGPIHLAGHTLDGIFSNYNALKIKQILPLS